MKEFSYIPKNEKYVDPCCLFNNNHMVSQSQEQNPIMNFAVPFLKMLTLYTLQALESSISLRIACSFLRLSNLDAQVIA